MAKMNKVCVNIDQSDSFTDSEKKIARNNIAANGGLKLVYLTNSFAEVKSVMTDRYYPLLRVGNSSSGIFLTLSYASESLIIFSHVKDKVISEYSINSSNVWSNSSYSINGVWTKEVVQSPISWTNAGAFTTKLIKEFSVPALSTLDVVVQGLAEFTAASGEAIILLQLGTANEYIQTPKFLTNLVSLFPNTAVGNAYASFSQEIHYKNESSSNETLYLSAYNQYGIGGNLMELHSNSPNDGVGPNIQYRIL